MAESESIFVRTERLTGHSALEKLNRTNVLLVGTGGVGSWCAEALVRSGVMHITIVDSDKVAASNVNRQLMATSQNIGEDKVKVLKDRLLIINPKAEVNAICARFSEAEADDFHLEKYDYIIDAIDSIPDKASLILRALKTKATLYSSMGAALKTDPSRIAVAEFWKVHGCPLARALRNRFKKTEQFPSRKFQCVFSDEQLRNVTQDENDPGNGSVVHITATFGLRIASLLFNDVTGLTGH